MDSHAKPLADEPTPGPLPELPDFVSALAELPAPDSFPEAGRPDASVSAASDEADWFSNFTNVPWLRPPAEEPPAFVSAAELRDLSRERPPQPPKPEPTAEPPDSFWSIDIHSPPLPPVSRQPREPGPAPEQPEVVSEALPEPNWLADLTDLGEPPAWPDLEERTNRDEVELPDLEQFNPAGDAEQPDLDHCPLPDVPVGQASSLPYGSAALPSEGPPSLTASAFLDALLAQKAPMTAPEPPLLLDDPLAEVDPGKPYLQFILGGQDYAVGLTNVLEIGSPAAITPLPHVPEWLLGVSNLRGDILSVVDLRLFFGLPRARPDTSPKRQRGDGPGAGASGLGRGQARLLVVHSTQDHLTTGLLVDGARAICRLTDDRITEVITPVELPILPYLLGQADHGPRTLRILDLERLLQSPEMRKFEEAEGAVGHVSSVPATRHVGNVPHGAPEGPC